MPASLSFSSAMLRRRREIDGRTASIMTRERRRERGVEMSRNEKVKRASAVRCLLCTTCPRYDEWDIAAGGMMEDYISLGLCRSCCDDQVQNAHVESSGPSC
jgi:hypothetical protein